MLLNSINHAPIIELFSMLNERDEILKWYVLEFGQRVVIRTHLFPKFKIVAPLIVGIHPKTTDHCEFIQFVVRDTDQVIRFLAVNLNADGRTHKIGVSMRGIFYRTAKRTK